MISRWWMLGLVILGFSGPVQAAGAVLEDRRAWTADDETYSTMLQKYGPQEATDISQWHSPLARALGADHIGGLKLAQAQVVSPLVPDEATKKRALLRAYELNGNRMCCGSIDVSQDPIVTGRIVITPETEFNVLDGASVPPKKFPK